MRQGQNLIVSFTTGRRKGQTLNFTVRGFDHAGNVKIHTTDVRGAFANLSLIDNGDGTGRAIDWFLEDAGKVQFWRVGVEKTY